MPQTLSPQEAERLIAAGGLDIVDVRGAEEWTAGHVPGARLLPLADLRDDPRRGLPRDRVLFVCAQGSRSMSAARVAEGIGMREVWSLEGGTLGWARAGLPIEAPAVVESTANQTHDDRPVTGGGCAMPSPSLDGVIGTNLRHLRARHDLSLDSLAKVTGLGRSLLGQIENGRVSPSVAVVWKIARAFDVPFSALLASAERPTTSVVRRDGARRLVSPDGRFSSRALYPLTEETNVEFYELMFAPHSREDAAPHRLGTRENLVVASGRLVLVVDGERYELGTGDAINFVADVPHSYENPGAQECWVYLVMTYVSRDG